MALLIGESGKAWDEGMYNPLPISHPPFGIFFVTMPLVAVILLGPGGRESDATLSGQSYYMCSPGTLKSVRWATIPQEPPRLVAGRGTKADDPTERKIAFVSQMLPLIHQINEEIERDRRTIEQVMTCRAEGVALDPLLRARLRFLKERYKADGDLDRLYRRIDVVPPSLALAQGAIESGWGTSRFVRAGNAVFGQYTDPDGGGLVPARVAEKSPVRLAHFPDIEASVRSYIHNLNTHPAYEGFRTLRAEMRSRSRPLDGPALAETLLRYSARGKAYIQDVKAIIARNDLHAYDLLVATEVAAAFDASL